MAKVAELGRTNLAIKPELKEFLDTCLVPLLVRHALREIRTSESRAEDLESTASLRAPCANGGSE
jgi:hypothetical protein